MPSLVVGTDALDVSPIVEQIRAGNFAGGRAALRQLRRTAYPGESFSGTTCRSKPAFALLVAAERKLSADQADLANNYLRQLQCLSASDELLLSRQALDRLARKLRGFAPAPVNECPFPLGESALARSVELLEEDRVDDAWQAFVQSACLLGIEHTGVSQAFDRFMVIADPPAAAVEAPIIVRDPRQPDDDGDTSGSRGTLPTRPSDSQPESVPGEGEDTRSTGGETDFETLIENQKTPGEIAYNPPATMRIGRSELIEVRIQPGRVNTVEMIGTGTARIDKIGVTSSMSVRLCCGPPAEDHAFDIVPQSSERQLVGANGFTQWVFEVTPRRRGTQTLKLSVSAQYSLPNGEVIPKDFPVTTKQIDVLVDRDRIPSIWPISLAVLAALGALAAAFVWWRRRRGIGIFVSYRRAETSGWVRTLSDRLGSHFGEGHVFMDVQDIKPGADFTVTLTASLKVTRVVLVVIGRQWVEITGAAGRRRLDDPHDWVRQEVQAALDSGKEVIPVLVDGAEMPSADELPESIRALARRHAVKLYPDQLDSGVAMLISAIESTSH